MIVVIITVMIINIYILLCHHHHNPHHQPELSEIEEARCEAAATLVAGGFNRFNCLRKENESKTSVPPTPPPTPSIPATLADIIFGNE